MNNRCIFRQILKAEFYSISYFKFSRIPSAVLPILLIALSRFYTAVNIVLTFFIKTS